MKLGPELDRLIAEKVMGWPADEWHQSCNDCTKWSPSTNIAHAWEVMERVGLMLFPVSARKDRSAGWAAARTDQGGEPTHNSCWIDDSFAIYEVAPTAPHAICLAALKSVE